MLCDGSSTFAGDEWLPANTFRIFSLYYAYAEGELLSWSQRDASSASAYTSCVASGGFWDAKEHNNEQQLFSGNVHGSW